MFGTSNLSETTCSLHRYNTGFKFQSQKRVWKITVTWSSPGLVLVYISHINTFEGQIRTKLRKEKGGLKMCVLNLCLCIHSTHHTRINTNTSSTLSNYSYILTGWEGGWGGAASRLDPVVTVLHADAAQPTNKDSRRRPAWDRALRNKESLSFCQQACFIDSHVGVRSTQTATTAMTTKAPGKQKQASPFCL